MRSRAVRLIVFFDLPVETAQERKNYTKFRKLLVKNGFIMIQYSVYSKLLLNSTQAKAVKSLLAKIVPPNGLVQCLQISERQFAEIEYLVGEKSTLFVDGTERWIEVK